MENLQNQDDKKLKKFEIVIFRLIRIKTEGYNIEDNQKIFEVVTKFKHLWLLVVCFIILTVGICLSGKEAWDFFKDMIKSP